MAAPSYNPSLQTVRAKCSHCDGASSVFQFQTNAQVQVSESRTIGDNAYAYLSYMLFRCPGCGHGAMAVLRHGGDPADQIPGRTHLESFHPFAGDADSLPAKTPEDIQTELHEAQPGPPAEAHRATSAGTRSRLERTLTEDGLRQRTELILVALLVLFGLVLRLVEAARTYLNPDEIQYFFLAVPSSFKELFLSTLSTDHPPLLIFLLHPVVSVTSSELALRLIPVLAGAIFPWVVYRWLAKVWNSGAGLAALVILTFSPNLVYLSAQIRGYTIELLFAALALLFLETALGNGSTRAMILFTISLYLAILSEYSAAWFAGAVGIYFLMRAYERKISPRLWVVWALGQAGALAIYMGLYQIAMKPRLAARNGSVEDYLQSAFPVARENLLAFALRGTLRQFAYTFSTTRFFGIAAALLFAAALAILWMGRSRSDRARNRILATLLVVPFLLACLGAILKLHPYGQSRHTVVLSLFVAAGAGIALERIFRARPWTAGVAAVTLGLVWLLAAPPDINNIVPSRHRRTSMIAAMNYVRSTIPPGSLIMTDHETNWLLHFYVPGRQEVRLKTYIDSPGAQPVGPFQATWRRWDFGPVGPFLEDLASVRHEFGVSPETPIWIVDGGFHANLYVRLRRRFQGLYLPGFHDFDGAVVVFQIPPGELAAH